MRRLLSRLRRQQLTALAYVLDRFVWVVSPRLEDHARFLRLAFVLAWASLIIQRANEIELMGGVLHQLFFKSRSEASKAVIRQSTQARFTKGSTRSLRRVIPG